MTMALAGSASNLQLPTATYKLLCVSPPPPRSYPPSPICLIQDDHLVPPGGQCHL